MHSLATRKDLIHLKTFKVIFDFYKSCIDYYSVWPNYFFPNHIFSFFKTQLIPSPSANVCKDPNPPFESCLYNGSYLRNGRLLHQRFLRHILISSGWRQNLFLAAWRGSLSEAGAASVHSSKPGKTSAPSWGSWIQSNQGLHPSISPFSQPQWECLVFWRWSPAKSDQPMDADP